MWSEGELIVAVLRMPPKWLLLLMKQGNVPVVRAWDHLGLVRFGHMILSTVYPPPISSLPLPGGLDDGLEGGGDLVLSVGGDDRSAVGMSVIPLKIYSSVPFPVSCIKMGEYSRESGRQKLNIELGWKTGWS